MKLRIDLDTELEDAYKAWRIIKCEAAFDLIWDISQICREAFDHEPDKLNEEYMQRIHDLITDSHLLELYF